MAISGISINPPASSPVNNSVSQIFNNASTPVVDKTKSSADTPPSTIVTLSAQAQKLSQAASNQSSNQTSNPTSAQSSSQASSQAVPEEANEAPGIQFMEGQTRGGRISTFA